MDMGMGMSMSMREGDASLNGPDTSSIAYRRMEAVDARAYRLLRLEALRLAPAAFGGSFEEERAKGEDVVARAIERNVIIGACRADGDLVATVGMFRRAGTKSQHKAVLFGLFVSPAWRARGVGGALVDRIIAEARPISEALQLSVATSSVDALRLYRGRGFRDYGLERRALKLGDDYVDEYLMELILHDR